MTFTNSELELAAQHADRWPVGEDGEQFFVGQKRLGRIDWNSCEDRSLY